MTPIIAFIGYSESGKTTLLAGIIAELKQRGIKVAAIKHTHAFEVDKEGSSSWHLGQAGAATVVVSNTREVVIIKKPDHDLEPQEIACLIGNDVDLILTEGFKKGSTVKIEVHRKEDGNELMVPANQLIAVVTDEIMDVKPPQYKRNDITGLSDLIIKWLAAQTKDEIELFVDEQNIPLNEFVRDFMSGTVVGMISSLKGVGEIKNVRLSLRRKP
jgi:molybdopterin-guanine dinucleotide biosynthesis adapter protein